MSIRTANLLSHQPDIPQSLAAVAGQLVMMAQANHGSVLQQLGGRYSVGFYRLREFLSLKQRRMKKSPTTRWLANRVRLAGALCPCVDGEPRNGSSTMRELFRLGVWEKGDESIIVVGFDAWLLMEWRPWITMARKCHVMRLDRSRY